MSFHSKFRILDHTFILLKIFENETLVFLKVNNIQMFYFYQVLFLSEIRTLSLKQNKKNIN